LLVSNQDIVVYLILSAGLLAMPIGAFGLLNALGGNTRRGNRRVTALIGLYGVGVLLSAFAVALAGHWYLGAPLILMLIPAEPALRKHGALGRRARIKL
jgi:hypothetical protein